MRVVVAVGGVVVDHASAAYDAPLPFAIGEWEPGPVKIGCTPSRPCTVYSVSAL